MKTYMTVHAVAVYKNQVLVLQRANGRSNPGKWNCVTGYVQERESAEVAAVRELKEETNLEGELIKTTEPFWADSDDIRWTVVSSLIKIKDISDMKIDENESRAYQWINFDDQIVKNSKALQMSLAKLGLLL